MIKYYNFLSSSIRAEYKSGVGDRVGSPPKAKTESTSKSWITLLLLFLSLTIGQIAGAQNINNYGFTSGTDGSLEDLSTGSTTIMTGVNDDTGGTVTAIGFDFWFMGVKYTHFSANSNGQMKLHTSASDTAAASQQSSPVANTAILAPMTGDNEVGNGIRIKVIGSAPNRRLVVEWNQYYVNFVNLTNAGNMQAWLSETTGEITFMYGEIYNSSTSSQTRSIFIASSNTATTAGSVTIGATPTFTASATLVSNTIAAGANPVGAPLIANIGSAADGSRRYFRFTPPSITPADPTTLTFSAVTLSTITPNWIDDSTNEAGFLVTRALDAGFTTGVVTAVVASTTTGTIGTAYALPQTGLSAGTTYFYRVQAVVEGAGSNPGLSGSQATVAGTTYYWVGLSGGTWSTAANWNTAADGTGSSRSTVLTSDILIVDGAGTTPGGSLIISVDTASFSIGQFKLTSNTTCNLQSSITTTRTITITGGGGSDFVVEAGSTLNLTNATNPVAFAFSGASNTGDISGTLGFAGSTSNVVTTTGGTGTLVTVAPSGIVNLGATGNSLVGSVATLSFTAGSNCNSTGATTGAPPVPLATWATTANLTITGITTSTTAPTNNNQSFGNINYNCPTATGTMSFFTSTTGAVVKGDLTITAGATGGTGIFRAVTSGTVNVNGSVNVLQGRLQSASGTGTLIANGNTNISANGILDCLAGTYSQRGNVFTNDGTLTGPAGTLQFLNFTGSAAQTLAGSGTVLTNIATLSMQNTAGLTITHANQVVLARVNLFQGTITNSNKITFGTGLAVNCTTQTGATGLTTPGGSFDTIPTFNLGTGAYNLIYAGETVSRTTGNEIPLTRSVSALTALNPNGIIVSGGALSTGTLTFGAGTGNITTSSANVLTVTGTTLANIVRTSLTAYVNGPLALTLPASLVTGSTYLFPIGKSALNPFALVNPTTNAGGTVTVQAEVFDADAAGTPGLNISSLSTTKYWAASITNGAANFTDALIQLTDTTTGRDAIAGSATVNGAYDLQGGVAITTTPTSLTTTAPANTTLPGFFLMANKAAATIANLTISPTGNQCTNVARTVTAEVTPGGGAVTGVVIDYSINGVAQTAITMTNTTGNGGLAMDVWSGTIPTVAPVNALVAWSITATDVNLLTKSQAGTSYTDEPLLAFPATATASVTNICGSGSSVLTASMSSSVNATIGTGITLTGATTQPTAFCNRWPSYRMQTVYTATELQAAGLSAGNITAMSFNISTLGDGATNSGFEVKVGTTGLSTLSGDFQSTAGYTTVYPSQTYTHTASGLQTIPFSTPFAWDGTSNIIVEVIHNGANSINNSQTFYTATAGNTVAYTTTNASNAASFSNQRLNVVFAGTAGAPIDSVLWSNGDTGVTTTVSPTSTTTYTATITSGGCTKVTTPVTVNVVALPTAPTQVGFDATCGTAVPLVSVSDPNGFTTPTINWYADNTATTPLQSSTSTTFNSIINTTTTFFVSVVSPISGCESARTSVTANVNTPDPIDAIANQSICLADTFSATATSVNASYAYTWSAVPSVGSGVETPVTGASQTILPTAAGTYTYTVAATDGICFTSTTFTVTVSAYPVFASVSATPTSVCADGISTLTATIPGSLVFTPSTGATLDPMTGATTVIITSNDDTPTAAPAAIGFTFNFNGVDYSQYSVSPDGWILLGGAIAANQFTNVTTSTTNIPKLYPYWDDLATGTTGSVRTLVTGTAPNRIFKVEWNVTIPRDLVGAANSTFQAWLYESSNKVEYRYGTMGTPSFGSASVGYTVNATTFSNITLGSNTESTVTANDVNTTVPTSGTMFAYTLPVPGNVTWSPVTDLYTDAAATIPYTGTNASVVYSKPVITTIYTANLEGAGGCSTDSAPITVTQNNIEIAEITGGATDACLGSSIVDFDNATTGITWTSSNPAVATVDANGLLTILSLGTTTIGAFIFDGGTNCTSYAPNTIDVTVYAPLAISTQPVPQNVLPSTVATFSIAASGSIVSYQWQVSPNNSTWSNLANDATYSGVGTNTLSINAELPLNGLYFRCVVSGNGSCATPLNSNSAQLGVNDLAISDDPDSATLCTTGAGSATFNVTFTGATPDQIVWEYFDLTDWVVIDGSETTLGSVTYTGETTTSLTLNGLSIVNNGWKVRVNGLIVSPEIIVTSAEATITVNTPATISQNPGNASACFSGATSSFSVIAAGGTGYQWQYATSSTGPWSNVVNDTPVGATYSGATSDTLNVTTTAATPAAGTYFYQLVVTSPASCDDAISTPAQLQIKTPTITANASQSFVCNPGGDPVTLTAGGAGAGGTYSWSPADGLSATTGDTVTANPTSTTMYTVTGTDSTGCSNTATVTIIVAPALAPTATATPGTVCSGTNAQLLATSGVPGEGTPSAYCTPTVGNGGSSADFINDFIFADISNLANGDDPTDYSDYTSLTANVVGGSTYPISITPGSPTWSQGFRVFIDYNKNGVFEASESVYASASASTATSSGTITIPLSALNGVTRLRVVDEFSAVPNTTSACGHTGFGEFEDYSVNISGATSPPVYTYSWSPATFLSATNVANPIATAVTATTTYTVTVTSSTGCNATQEVTVTVADDIAITTQPANASFCEGTEATLSVVATGAGLTYQWRKAGVDIFGAISSTLTIPAATVADSGSYDVVINSICGGPAVISDAVTLTIFPTPVATSPGAQSSCAGTTVAIPLTGTPSGVTFNISGGAAIGLADQTGVLAIPSFTAIAGSATISITPSANACLGNAVTFLYTVNPTPDTPVVSSNTPVDCGGTLNLAASTVSITGYAMNANSGVSFIDIAGTGTSVGTLSDDSEHNITIPSFTFNGVAYTAARLGMNGTIVLGSTAGEVTHINAALPSTAHSAGNVFLAPFWDDLDIQTAATVVTQTVGSMHIIQYTTAAHDAFTTGSITFQVQLDLVTGAINYVYPDVIFGNVTQDAGASATVGIQLSSTSAVQYSFSTASLVNGQSITFTPNTAAYSWTGPNGFTSSVQNPTISGVTAAAAGDYVLTVSNPATGCSAAPVTHTVAVVNCESVVNLKLFIEGYYNGSGTMKPVKNNQDFVSPTTDVADIVVELYDASTLTLVTSTTALLLTDGTAVCTFATAPSGSFYLTVRGSNFIQTWSAAPVSVGSTPLTYDFSDAANKAYGDNMVLLETGVYGLFSGELNADGNIDNADYLIWETDANNFEFGVFPTDLNGDGNVDNADYLFWETNANNFVFSVTPTP